MVHFFTAMAYRPTQRTEAKRAATREGIVRAATELVARGGYREAQVAAVAQRAGVATGTVYRHFPSKADLLTEVFRVASQPSPPRPALLPEVSRVASQREADGVARARSGSGTAPERRAAAVETFARRALQGRRLAGALLAEPVDPAVEAQRLQFRRAFA